MPQINNGTLAVYVEGSGTAAKTNTITLSSGQFRESLRHQDAAGERFAFELTWYSVDGGQAIVGAEDALSVDVLILGRGA